MRISQITESVWFNRTPHALIGVGLLLGGVMAAELLAIARTPIEFTITMTANFLATLPFIAILIGGGYWLLQSTIPPDRYPRIVGWTGVGIAFLTGFFIIIALFTQDEMLVRIGIVRWAVAAGAGSGVLVGIFEARAIDRAVAAERVQIRNEELKKQNDRLEDFASILSHDLRNPLNVAEGYVELLQDEYGDEHFDRIATAHDRMGQIIEETLLLARSGQVIDDPEPVSLAEVIDQCWANVDTKAATLAVESTATIVADADRLHHLFENLFRNAVEHGGTDVTIRVGMLENGFYVEDDGEGFPENERDEIFSFGHSAAEEGTGFGLAIVKEIGDAHDWEIRATDGEDGGARIEITGVDREEPQHVGTSHLAATTER